MYIYCPQELKLINKRLDILVEQLKNERILDVDDRGDMERTALHMAAICDREDAVSILVKHGADVNCRDSYGNTALQFAKTAKVARILLEGGADPCTEAHNGGTVLHCAVNYCLVEVVSCLIQFGAIIDASDLNGEKPLRRARTEEVARILLYNGANVHARCRKGETALHSSALNGFEDVVSVLIEFGAKVNIRDEDYRTPLHLAGTAKVVRILLESGADPNAKDKNGRTALHYGVRYFHLQENIPVLLEFGADSNLQADDGKTPLSSAFERHRRGYRHCAKGSLLANVSLKLANLKVFEENIKSVAGIILKSYSERLNESSFDLDTFMNRCVNESNQLKIHKLVGVKPLHSILHTTNPMYLSNKSLAYALSEVDFTIYLIYGQLLVTKIKSDMLRYKLVRSAWTYFNSLLQNARDRNGFALPTLPYEVDLKILQYLDNEDLERVILCDKGMKRLSSNRFLRLWKKRKCQNKRCR